VEGGAAPFEGPVVQTGGGTAVVAFSPSGWLINRENPARPAAAVSDGARRRLVHRVLTAPLMPHGGLSLAVHETPRIIPVMPDKRKADQAVRAISFAWRD